ncbi:MAG: sodium:proton antiporter [Bacteroidales bacterium]|nr:sodium:proton antiporter [Bacteroidales bacterium]
MSKKLPKSIPLGVALIPIIFLLVGLITLIAVKGSGAVNEWSAPILLSAAALSVAISVACYHRPWRAILLGMIKSFRQIIPSFPVLLLIGAVSATWMLSGTVPMLIEWGLEILNPTLFLFITCAVCSIISVLTGSSWTTIATIGVAFMGIGTVIGYSPGWIAGAIISGAYFGDKVSPLSDTTVLASSSTGVRLFTHIRYLMITSVPAMLIALTVFLIAGFTADHVGRTDTLEMENALHATFNLTPWLLIVPAITITAIAIRFNTCIVLAISAMTGLAAIFIFQPQVVAAFIDMGHSNFTAAAHIFLTDTALATGHPLLDDLVATGGMKGMLPTVELVAAAMVFGGALMGSGMLTSITSAFTRKLDGPRSVVTATVGSGLFLNSCTADQYLSIIIGGNLYKKIYNRNRLESKLLSRSLEDSISVTSVLIPWNSCGVTQSAVLGVATLTYLPYCIFNFLSPLMSLTMAWTGFRIRRLHLHHAKNKSGLHN